MSEEISLLLKETEQMLDKNAVEDTDDLHSKIVGLYISIQEYAGEEKDNFIDAYNILVDRAKDAGISRIKKLIGKPVESASTKKREIPASDQNTEKIAAAILDHSRVLKKKTESFGKMVDNSKSFIENVSAGMRQNVKHVQKGLSSLENKEWYSISTTQAVFLLISVILVFVLMYFLIRMA